MMKKRNLIFVGLVLLLGACTEMTTGSSYASPPVGVGPSVKELKKAPCACLEIPMNIPLDALDAGGRMSSV